MQLVSITPTKKKGQRVIRTSCCNYDRGNCIALDDGEPCVCVQSISYTLCCTWFRDWVLPGTPILYSGNHGGEGSQAVCGMRRSISGQVQSEPNIAQNVPVRFTADRKQQVTGNGGRETTNRVLPCGYIPHLKTGTYGGEYAVSLTPSKSGF